MLDQVTHSKWPNSHISMNRMGAIFTYLTVKIFDHLHLENCCDLIHFTILSIDSKIVIELIFWLLLYDLDRYEGTF